VTEDELLTTTRTVRKRLDLSRPVALDLIRECLEIALQAPSGSNAQGWHFVVVQDEGQKHELARIYRKAFHTYRALPQSAHALAEVAEGDDKPRMERVVDSAEYLAENLERVPTLLIPCFEGRVDVLPPPVANAAQASAFASIYPAAWSFILAARSRGLGCALTTVHLLREREAAEVLGIPYARVTQAGLVAVGYYTGSGFKPAPRKPLDSLLHLDDW
jgi:nitroreductase